MNLLLIIYGFALLNSFLLSLVLTEGFRVFALKLNIVDVPYGRKSHKEPTPLLGGAAIFLTFNIFLLLMFALYQVSLLLRDLVGGGSVFDFLGQGSFKKIIGLSIGGGLIFLLGLIDDIYTLGAWTKLFGQIFSASLVVLCGIRIEMFFLSHWFFSYIVTVGWIVLLTNSLNLLDNMDGLCGGISFICAMAFFFCIQPYDEFLIRFLLVVFAGSVGGFLFHNISPAKIFMGDAGSQFCGYFLSTISVLGTYHLEGTPSRVAILAPVVIMSVPLFDTFSVIYLRWKSGHSIFVGDKRHFSHRLVELGMTTKQAVEFIWLVGIITSISAWFLPVLGFYQSGLVLLQVVGIYILIVLLMNAPKGILKNGNNKATSVDGMSENDEEK